MTYALEFTAHHRHPDSSIWDLVPGKPGKTPPLPSLAGGMSLSPWPAWHFQVREIPSWPSTQSAYVAKWWHLINFFSPLTSKVTMSRRPYPAIVFTFVNFSTTEMSRFILLSKNVSSSDFEFLTGNVFWCLLLRSHIMKGGERRGERAYFGALVKRK